MRARVLADAFGNKFRARTFELSLLASTLIPGAAFAQTSPSGTPGAASGAQSPADAGLEEIIVTSQKVAQPLSKVPVSVTALSEESLTIQRIETPTDLARVAPGLVFIDNAGSGEQRNSEIFIRGIASGNGVPTVGVYLDDTPITIRTIATGGTDNFYPNFFDLDRIEVLRGPQGTLFGVGSEAGTVRFITTAPSLTTFSGNAKADFGFTSGGDPSYEDGIAVGGPIVQEKIGFRASLYYREDGGYIDRNSIYTNAVTEPNQNKTLTYSGRLALEFAPTDDLTVTPTIFAQRVISSGTSIYYPATQYTTPTGQTLNYTGGDWRPNSNDLRDQFAIGSLEIKYDGLDWVTFQSNTAYTYRQQLETDDIPWINLFGLTTPFVPGDPGYSDRSPDQNWEHTISQELRFTSHNDADSPWFWQGGVFYTRTNQSSTQIVFSDTFGGLANALPGLFPPNFANLIGFNNATDYDVYVHQVVQDKQESVFGELHYKVLPSVTLRAGLRYEYDSSQFGTQQGGPAGGGSGLGLQTPYPLVLEGEAAHPIIPKFGIDWQVDDENLVYLTVSKGARLGGPNTVPDLVSPVCTENLHALGLSGIPQTFQPDHVWSYEVGTKNRFLDDHLQIDASAYYIDWENVQQSVSIGCPTAFYANLGAATSKGFELSITGRPIAGLTLSANVGYTNATFNDTIASGTLAVARAGDPLPNVLPWTAHVSAEYDLPLSDNVLLYFRGDYQWLDSEPKGDPLVAGWDPVLRSNGTFAPNPAYGLVNLRAGAQYGDADLSLYILNATDNNPKLDYGRDQPLTTNYFKYSEIRPITVGFTLLYKFTLDGEPETAPAAYVPPPVQAPAPAPSVARSYMVFFDFNKSDLSPQAVAIVDQAARNAAPAKATELVVTGHTDTVGSDAYNMRLSRRRAESVAAELEKQGIPSSEVEIVAKGKHDLLVPTGDGVREPQNRRVTIVYGGGAMS